MIPGANRYKTKTPVSRQSGGTSGDLTLKGYKPKTPVVRETVLPSVERTQSAPKPLRRARRVKSAKLRGLLAQGEERRERASERIAPKKYKAPGVERRESDLQPLPPQARNSIPGPKGNDSQAKRDSVHGLPGVSEKEFPKVARSLDAATSIVSSVPGKGPRVTRQKRKAAKTELRKAKKAVRKSQPSLKGLAPQEAEVVKYARKAHRKYPDVPASLLMSLMRQESGFQADAVSSANAQGLTQFIPSTAESYGVQYGTGKREKQSQVTGAAKLLTDSGFASDPKGALTRYTGGYSDAEYNNPVLEGAKDYLAVDKAGSPKARKRLARAKKEAANLGVTDSPTSELDRLYQKAGYAKSGESWVPTGRDSVKRLNKLIDQSGRSINELTDEALGIKNGAPRKVVTRYKAINKAATALEKAGIPYVYGGGHESGTPKDPKAGLDCSSSTVWVLNKAGVKIPNIVSGEFGNYLPSGPGAVTVFYNPTHVFMRIGDRYYGTSTSNPDSGPGFIDPPSESYLSTFNVAHVPGLGKKQALQLGINDLSGGGSSFPGMTLSSNGTTATINSGAGTKRKEPGFSNQPISPAERVLETQKKLRDLGVGVDSTKTSQSSTQVLDELAKRYGVAA